MLHSAVEFSSGDDSPQRATVALRVFLEGVKPRLMLVDQEQFTIGSSEQCDLRLRGEELPRLHSVLHIQGQTVWIEAIDDGTVTVDGHAYRRRALRDGDELQFDGIRAIVQIGERSSLKSPIPAPHSPRMTDDLAAMSAEELCDHIELEEVQIHEFEQRKRLGWQALMSAVREMADQEAILAPHPLPSTQVAAISDEKFDELITHVRVLSETLEARTQALVAQESLLIESSSQLCDSQVRVSRQLEELLQRIAPEESSGELRASA